MSSNKSDYSTIFGGRLKSARKEAGITQAQLADQSGIAKDTLSRYERGGMSPSAEMIIRLSETLAVSPAWLLTGSESFTSKDTSTPKVAGEPSEVHLREGCCVGLVSTDTGIFTRIVFHTLNLNFMLSEVRRNQENHNAFPKEIAANFELVQEYLSEAHVEFTCDAIMSSDGVAIKPSGLEKS